jgi:hypothetical protein
MLLIKFAGTGKSLENMKDKIPHFFIIISGRMKGMQLLGSKLGRPCVSVTKGTHTRPGLWLDQLVPLMKAHGLSSGGRLFQQNLVPSKLFEFEYDFFTLIKHVQSSTDLIDSALDVPDILVFLDLCDASSLLMPRYGVSGCVDKHDKAMEGHISQTVKLEWHILIWRMSTHI